MAKRIYFPGKCEIPPVPVETTVSRVRWPLKPHLVQLARQEEKKEKDHHSVIWGLFVCLFSVRSDLS